MAKACESLDHLEDFPFRQVLVESNSAVFRTLLVEASRRNMDLLAAYRNRIDQVEAQSPRRIFD